MLTVQLLEIPIRVAAELGFLDWETLVQVLKYFCAITLYNFHERETTGFLAVYCVSLLWVRGFKKQCFGKLIVRYIWFKLLNREDAKGLRFSHVSPCWDSIFSSIILRAWVEVLPRLEPRAPSLKDNGGDHAQHHTIAKMYRGYYTVVQTYEFIFELRNKYFTNERTDIFKPLFNVLFIISS